VRLPFQIAANIFFVLFLVWVAWTIRQHQEKEERYLHETPVAVQAQHKKLAEEIKNLPQGTFLKMDNDSLLFLRDQEFGVSDDRKQGMIWVCRYPGIAEQQMLVALGRHTIQVIPPHTPEWCTASEKFLIGYAK
jgi:hypothetical protein